MEDEPRIKIGFNYTNEVGDTFTASSDVGYFPSFGETELSTIVDYFNKFLSQAGFVRKQNMLEESLTDEEYTLMSDYLEKIRGKQ